MKYKTKDEAIAALIQNPKYDSDWIGNASELLILNAEDTFTEEELAKMNAKQLSVIADMVKTNEHIRTTDAYKCDFRPTIPIHDIIKEEFNATQMELLRYAYGCDDMGTQQYRDLNIFMTLDLPYAKLNYLVKGFTEGFTSIMEYINFDAAQIAEIYSGWKDGVDYTKYANAELTGDEMSLARHFLVIGKENCQNLLKQGNFKRIFE